MNSEIHDTVDAVAVIGLAGRFPGARNVDEYWRNLTEGTESISFFSEEELLASGVSPELIANPNYVRAKGILNNVADFDAAFFGFNPREAEILDPQHRLFLEAAWHAMEDGGYDPARCQDYRIGIFAGCGTTTYLFQIYNNREIMQQASSLSILTSNDKDYLTTRTSYKLNLRGPSVNVQSACSTSLVAVSTAVHSILNYQCDMALAGGVSVRCPEATGYLHQEGSIVSPDGHCRAFDVNAKGTVFSSGLGVVLLKRLSDAVADRDHIYAVIRGAAVNNDGNVKIGYTAPSMDGQAEAAAEALAMAGVHVEDIGYVETHGTATPLGDPIEIGALTKVFRRETEKKRYCAIGSVKTNIGHTDIAAGVAGFIKTTLAVKHGKIPPSLHFTAPNPELHLDDSPFFVATRLMPWQQAGLRRAAVSSFGVGGTNANVILEQAPERETAPARRSLQLLTLSARTDSALQTVGESFSAYLKQQSDGEFADIAYTTKVGRAEFDYRHAIVAADRSEAIAILEGSHEGEVRAIVAVENAPVVFMFSGQGSQYVNMAKGLYETEPMFRMELDRCCDGLVAHLGFDLREVLYPTEEAAQAAAEALRQTDVTQPALFAIEYATAKLWMSWGVVPEAMIGHSIGEYVAACIAGVFSLDDALALVALRGRLMKSLPPGRMLAVMLPEARLRPLLDERLSIAAVNSAAVTVVSGPTEAITDLEAQLSASSIMFSKVATSHAFHSQMMEPILDTFTAAVAKVERLAPRIPYVSNVTGTWITAEEVTDPGYWSRHLRGAVQFARGVECLLEQPARIFLEVGPGHALLSSAKGISVDAANRAMFSSIRHPNSTESDARHLILTLAGLWANGVTVSWKAYYGDEARGRVRMPVYPFERETFLIERAQPAQTLDTKEIGQLLRKPDLADWFYFPSWKGTPTASTQIPTGTNPCDDTWLVFMDEFGAGNQVVQWLQARDCTVLQAHLGAVFAELAPGHYTLDPGSKEQAASLLQTIRSKVSGKLRILHFSNVANSELTTLDTLQACERDAYYGLLHLGQALSEYANPASLVVVSNRMQDLAGRGDGDPARALLVGPCRLIHKECPNVDCRSVDLDLRSGDDLTAQLAQQLVAEAMISAHTIMVAYRAGQRWIESFEPAHLDGSPDVFSHQLLREHGVYLLTGGLGGIGLAIGRDLARQFKARLVLIGRNTVPAREEWDHWLAEHHYSDATSHKVRGLLEIEQAGGEILTLAADVAELADMQRALEEAKRHFGRIDGVFHTAGVPGGSLIPLTTREHSEQVLRPKVRGTLVLEQVFAQERPDFMVLFSSLNATLAGTGQIAYTAANMFLENFAVRQQVRGHKVVSIGWDAWAEVGMGVDFEKRTGGGLARQGNLARLGHGLLEWMQENDGTRTYSASLSGASHWALGEHRVIDKPTLVGTAYIDMAVSAALDAMPGGAVELANVYILTPLTIDDDQRKAIELTIVGEGDEREFSFRSCQQRYGEEPGWQQHAIGVVRRTVPSGMKTHDLASIRARCAVSDDIATHANTATANIAFGQRWANLSELGIGNGEAIARLELPQTYTSDLGAYALHPALLDVATSFAKRYASKGFFLPISYRKITFHRALPQRFYSHVRFPIDNAEDSELIAFDITLMDEQGHELTAIEGYSLKRVPDSFFEQGRTTPPEAGRVSSKGGDDRGMSTADGIQAMRRILALDFPARILVSRFDLARRTERSYDKADRGIYDGRLKTKRTKTLHKRPKLKTAYVAPRNELEEQVADVWQSVLGIDEIGVNDGFLDLGGNSLLAVQVISRLRETFSVELPLEALYRAPTVAGIAEGILALMLESMDGDELSLLMEPEKARSAA